MGAPSLYLAARSEDQWAVRRLAQELTAAGLTVHARWLEVDLGIPCAGPDESELDLADLARGDVFVLWKPAHARGSRTTGGHHVESGIAMQLGKPLVLLGAPENVFHHHPRWVVVPDTAPRGVHAAIIHAAAQHGTPMSAETVSAAWRVGTGGL